MTKIKTIMALLALTVSTAVSAEKTCVEKCMSERAPLNYTISDLIDGKVDEKSVASPYHAGVLSVNPFASARLHDSDADYGAGVSASYALTDRLNVEADAISEGIDDSNWNDALKSVGAGLKFYFPINATGFAPYLLGGYQRDLIDHENRIQAGAGLEYRLAKSVTIFADAQVNHGFEQELRELGNDVRVRAGFGWKF